MNKYEPQQIEPKWQKYWDEQGIFKTTENNLKKYYILDMFPYPSSAGLHVGHPEGYTATDIVARYRRMKYKDEDVLHPMGFDAFGLPAENYAIKVGRNPREITRENITRFIEQLKSFGFSYDWDRQVVTCEPEYYKWTQWCFRELYKKGLAYKKMAPVNWCESCKTVLAREQVIDGKCERCKNQVIQKNLSQWFFKITDYAEELLSEVEKLDWPEAIKALQRNWIGKSVGAEVDFLVDGTDEKITVFTTRVDTIFSGTFIILAPEHYLVKKITTDERNEEVEKYLQETLKKSELERTDLNKDKTGVFTGAYAINPANNEKIQIWISDFVLAGYGTGAVFADAHDERDFEMAKKFNIPLKVSIKPVDENNWNKIEKLEECFTEEGVLVNSEQFDGLISTEAREKITNWLEEKGLGRKRINYKLRDWLVSRQRYWGAPIPVVYCPKCGEQLVEEKDLPVLLPEDVDFRPTGESPLVRSESFHKNVKCPKCGEMEGVRRESDTMDTFVCSSWYFLRYCDNKNEVAPFDKEKIKKWMPVDMYVGGAEHAVLHLMYARFFTKALRDMGHLDFGEPFLKLRNQGMILAEDGRKMSKSLGNVVNPDEVIKEHGADAFRLYEMFMGPLEDSKPWNTKGILGVNRFLNRAWSLQDKLQAPSSKLQINSKSQNQNSKLETLFQQTIKKVGEDIEDMKFNTAISQMMILLNEMDSQKEIFVNHYTTLVILLSPFAPHMAEELWQILGHDKSIIFEKWPEYDPALIKAEEFELVVQINGKVREKILVPAEIGEAEAKEKVIKSEKVLRWLEGKEPKKIIYIKGKLVSIVV